MIYDLSAHDMFLLGALYLIWGMIIVIIVALIPHGEAPRFSLLITWPFVLLKGLVALVWYLGRRLLSLLTSD